MPEVLLEYGGVDYVDGCLCYKCDGRLQTIHSKAQEFKAMCAKTALTNSELVCPSPPPVTPLAEVPYASGKVRRTFRPREPQVAEEVMEMHGTPLLLQFVSPGSNRTISIYASNKVCCLCFGGDRKLMTIDTYAGENNQLAGYITAYGGMKITQGKICTLCEGQLMQMGQLHTIFKEKCRAATAFYLNSVNKSPGKVVQSVYIS